MEPNNKPLEITQQQVNLIAAGVLMIAFFSFLAGYLSMPNRTTPLDTIEPIQPSLDSTTNLNRLFSSGALTETKRQNKTTDAASDSQGPKASAAIGAYFPLKGNGASHDTPQPKAEPTFMEEQNDKSDKEYYASVAGFGTVEAARICKERLQTLGITTQITTRTSASVSGVIRTWYQLITSRGNQREIEQRARRIQSIIQTVSVERIKP